MRLINITLLLLLSFSLLGQWVPYDSVGTTVNTIDKISFPTANIGYALGVESGTMKEIIYKTNDGADTWSDLGYPTSTNLDIQNMHFVDAQTGFLSVREGFSSSIIMKVYKTTNGGQNWTNISPTTTSTGYGNSSVHFINVDTGFFAIENEIFKTTNSGQSWSLSTLPTTYGEIQHIDFWNEQYGVAGGWDGTFAYTGILFYTNDGGLTWDEVTIPQAYTNVADVQRVSSTHIFVLSKHNFGAPYLFRSMNAGASWDSLDLSPFAVNNQDNFNTLFFQDENIGYIGTSKGNILKTTDAGQTWVIDYSFNGLNTSVSDIDFSTNAGYALSTDGKIAKMDNTTAIQNIHVSQAITGFPNPAINSYHLDLESIPNAKSIKVYNTAGRLFFNLSAPKGQPIINTQNWPAGIYIGTIEIENGAFRYFKLQKS